MKSSTLGFAGVLFCGIAVAPFLVRTDQFPPQAHDAPAFAAAKRVEALPIEGARSSEPDARHPAAFSSSSSTNLRIAVAR